MKKTEGLKGFYSLSKRLFSYANHWLNQNVSTVINVIVIAPGRHAFYLFKNTKVFCFQGKPIARCWIKQNFLMIKEAAFGVNAKIDKRNNLMKTVEVNRCLFNNLYSGVGCCKREKISV